MRRLFLCLFLVTLVTGACRSSEPAPLPTAEPGTLYIDPAVDLGPISPYLYGSNHGPWTAVPMDMIPVALDSGITALRWPGGNWGDRNKIQTYQLDQFIDFCNQMKAVPTISVNLRDGTPEDAAELVRYANLEKGYGIEYWSIGNEPTLFEEELGTTYDTEIFNPQWRKFAEAMKAVDPDILLMGPELHQWGTSLETTLKDSSGRDWMTEFLKANGDLVDIVTVHRYPLWKPPSESVTVSELRENTKEWDDMVIYLRGLIEEYTGKDLPIAFTEVNSDPSTKFRGEATPDSFYNAIWYADILGRMMGEHVFMVNHFVLSYRNSGLGLIAGSEIRPTYYTFQMYKHLGDQQVYSSSGVEDVTVYAAKREDGTLTLMLINLSDVEQSVTLDVNGIKLDKAESWLFDSSHNADNLGIQNLPAGGALILPLQSMTLYVIAP
jgi:hypothetical protein